MLRSLFSVIACFLLALPVLGSGRGREFLYSIDRIDVQGNGDSLYVSVDWTFRNWEIHDRKAMVFQLSLKGGGRELKLRPVCAYGRKAARASSFQKASGRKDELTVRDLSKPMRVRVEDSFPFDESLDTLKLYLSVGEWDARSGLMPLSYGLKAGYVRPDVPSFAGFEMRVAEPPAESSSLLPWDMSLPLDFSAGSQKFDPSLGGNAAAADSLLSRLRFFLGYKGLSILNAEMSLDFRPDEDAASALKLSQFRAASLYQYLYRQGGLSRLRMKRSGAGLDWNAVLSWFDASRYCSDARLREILVSGAGDVERLDLFRREKPQAWDSFCRECMPELGRVRIHFDYRPLSFSSRSDVWGVFDNAPELLSARDFWYLSTLYPTESQEWMDVVLSGVLHHPESVELCSAAVQGLVLRGGVREASPYVRLLTGGPGSPAVTDSECGQYAYAVWCFGMERYSECVDTLRSLSRTDFYYAKLYDVLVPFLKWQTNRLAWRKVVI